MNHTSKKKPSLKGAAKRIFGGLQFRLSSQARFGQSKHEAKQRAREDYLKTHGSLKGYNPAKVDGIYSIKTMETYRSAMEPFAKWLADQGAKNAAKITEEQAIQYLKAREAAGCSPSTVSRDMSAINKALGFQVNKKQAGLRYRCNKDIFRSRRETANDRRSFQNDQQQIALAKSCGCRRESVTTITPLDCKRNAAGLVVGIRVVEKGGKERIAPVLNEYKQQVTDIVNRATDAGSPIFASYDSHIDNHHFRAEYCKALMTQLEQEEAAGRPWFGGDLNPADYIHLRGKDRDVGATYRGHPTAVVAAVSGSMGHNRLEIIFSHYNYT